MIFNKIADKLYKRRKVFDRICDANHLNLDFQSNIKELEVLVGIFEHREYADYFPFYKNATIVDIGAHYGYFSIFAKLNSGKESKIISIEPNKENYKRFLQNIQSNNIENIRPLNFAIADKSGHAQLYKGANKNSSILSNYSLINSSISEAVEAKTLEDIIQEQGLSTIDFLKIDCEGAEYDILENLPKAVFDKITTISMEFHDLRSDKYTGEHIVNTLRLNGFDVVKYKYEETVWGLNYGKIIGTKVLQKN